MINAGGKDGQQIGEQFGLFLEIEGQCTVISRGGLKSIVHRKVHYFLHLDVRDLDDDLLELLVLPSIRRSFHHRKGGIIEFVVFDVEEDELGPQMRCLGCFDDLGDIDSGDKELEVVHDCKESQILSTD